MSQVGTTCSGELGTLTCVTTRRVAGSITSSVLASWFGT